jgi:hypothetical protein
MKRIFLFAILSACSPFSLSWGASQGSNSGVPVAGSIVMPGTTTAVYTNPAGLVGGTTLRLSLQAGSDEPMEDPNARALVIGGAEWFGAAAGVDYRLRDGNSSDYGYIVYGMGVLISPLDLTFGLAGWKGVQHVSNTDLNAGLIFRPTPGITLGGTVMGLSDQIDSIGAGIGLEIMSGIDFVVDSAFNRELKSGAFKPGIRVSNDFSGLSLSYGTDSSAQFADAFSAAAYLRISGNSEFEFEYNHGGDLPKYFGSLSFGF